MDTTTAIAQGEQALNMAPKLVEKIQSIVDSSFKYSSLQAIERYFVFYTCICCTLLPNSNKSSRKEVSFPQLDASTDSEAVM